MVTKNRKKLIIYLNNEGLSMRATKAEFCTYMHPGGGAIFFPQKKKYSILNFVLYILHSYIIIKLIKYNISIYVFLYIII